jgi:hypothetical protein
VLRRSVENLGLGANRHLNHLILWNAILIDLVKRSREKMLSSFRNVKRWRSWRSWRSRWSWRSRKKS